jgi:flagellar biosynthesis anti-sigma factor FlgM
MRSERKKGERDPEAGSTARSREIARLETLIQAVPDVREAKIREVRAKLRSGQYGVKAEEIAEKIIGDRLLDDLFQTKKPAKPDTGT